MNFLNLRDGEKLFYRDQGKGEAVILIHGWPLNGDMFEYQIPTLLDRGYRVITYDRRGFGRSSQPAMGYDYNTFASDLKDLINQLELQSCALVGFSMGGGEIARYLKAYGSQKISRVALVSSVLPYLVEDHGNPKGVDEKVFEKMIRGLREDRPHFLAGFAKDFYGQSLLGGSVSNEILQWTSMMALMASPKATMECVTAFGKTDFREDLTAFDVPTLVIHGTADKTVPMESSSEIAASMIPQAEFIRYEGAPHGLFVTHKERLTENLCDFLAAKKLSHEAPLSASALT